MKLIIVESPTKQKTIQNFLGKDFLVASSYGHIRDLPKSTLGVDLKNNFQPKYVIPPKAKPKVAELKKAAQKASQTILATDKDREGESIAFHLSEILGLKNPARIVFHEISKKAIENALKNPRQINEKLVESQQARRVLDRLVGYKLSPFLWKKVMRGLSAGRVQSVVVRLICEREKEIEKFQSQEYWSITAELEKIRLAGSKSFEASLNKINGKTLDKLEIKNETEAEKITKNLQNSKYIISQIQKKEEMRNPLPPFITSSLQREVWARFGFSAKRTMLAAQKLYETSFITYHRTDSLNLSEQSKKEANNFIKKHFGETYLPKNKRDFKTKSKTAQEAHEAIRPVSPINNTPEIISQKSQLSNDQQKLYTLIWQRFIACQMAAAKFDLVTVDIQAKEYGFRANGQTLRFDGFLKVYPMKFKENTLPQLKEKEELGLKKLIPLQHFTQPPARYSEAGLIKVLEKQEIGRPSTYAVIIDTIQQRNYVEKNEQKRFVPTKIGIIVNGLLTKHFPQIVDLKFTAKMEKELDEIADGKDKYVKTIRDFYLPFEKNLKEKEQEVAKTDLTEKTDKKCPLCGADIIIRQGRFGKFYACSAFPNCKYTENLPAPSLNIPCPKCQGEIVEKKTKRGKVFYGCSNWPKCSFAMWQKPINEKCPQCGLLLTETKTGKKFCPNKLCLSHSRK